MTHQRIRIRTDIFKSQQFALLEDEDRTDVVPLLPFSPVPSILNDKFNHIDELEVVCLGNGKNWDYNDNLSSKDLSNPNVTDILGEEPLHTGKANLISDAKYIQDTTKRIQNMKNWLLKQQDYGTSIQISKQIVEDEKSLEEAKMRFQPAVEEWLRSKSSIGRSLQPCLHNERIESIEGGNFSDAKYILDTSTRSSQEEIQAAYEEWPKTESTSTESVKSIITSSTSTLQPKINESTETTSKPVTFTNSDSLVNESIDVVKGGYFCSICKIKLNKGSLVSHLEGKRHAKIAKEVEKLRKLEEYKHKIASKNEISSREFIVITETNDGEMRQVCSL